MQNTRVYRGADWGIDHYLVVSTNRLKLRRVTKPSPRRKLAVDHLKDEATKNTFCTNLQNRLETLADTHRQERETGIDVEELWCTIRVAFTQTGEETLGYARYKRKEWISPGSWKLIDDRKELKRKVMSAQQSEKAEIQKSYARKNGEVKRSVKQDKRTYIDGKEEEAELAASKGDGRAFYRITKELSGRTYPPSKPVKNSNGEILTERADQLARWAGDFAGILNPPRMLPNQATELQINLNEPTTVEIRAAIKELKNNKAAGPDDVAAELLKADTATTTNILYPLFKEIWRTQKMPRDWQQGLIVKLPKKGDTADCNNWRGITLLSAVSKVLTCILLRRIQPSIDHLLRDEQAGFRKGRSCNDQIFTLRNIIEQCVEWQATEYLLTASTGKASGRYFVVTASPRRSSIWLKRSIIRFSL